jgi:hypothetical protein
VNCSSYIQIAAAPTNLGFSGPKRRSLQLAVAHIDSACLTSPQIDAAIKAPKNYIEAQERRSKSTSAAEIFRLFPRSSRFSAYFREAKFIFFVPSWKTTGVQSRPVKLLFGWPQIAQISQKRMWPGFICAIGAICGFNRAGLEAGAPRRNVSRDTSAPQSKIKNQKFKNDHACPRKPEARPPSTTP